MWPPFILFKRPKPTLKVDFDMVSQRINFTLYHGQNTIGSANIYSPTNCIWDFQIESQYRGYGYADILLDSIIEYEKRYGIETLKLYVEIENAIAQKLYKKHGFVLNPTIQEIYFKQAYEMTLQITNKQ